MKLKSKKSALLLSFTSLLLCFAMLAGSTFAWFTDTATTGVNQIVSGNLDLEVYHKTSGTSIGLEKINDLTNLFDNVEGSPIRWEPGAKAEETFVIKNEGNLALKYCFAVSYANATKTPADKTLADALTVSTATGEDNFDENRGERKAANTAFEGTQLADFSHEEYLLPGEYREIKMTIQWIPSANDNDFNVAGGLSVDLGINVLATQYTYEKDSFNNEYDKNAEYDKGDAPPADAKFVITEAELKEAIKEDEAYIVLQNDIELTSALTVAKAITLDLNGKTLNAIGSSYNAKNTIKLNGGADLTVKDTAEGGKITNSYSGSAAPATIDLQGTDAVFTLESGVVESNQKDTLQTLAISNSKKKACTVEIAGGTVTVAEGHQNSRAIVASNGMTVNISGGAVAGGLYGLDLYVGSNTTITGGSVTANAFDGRTDEYGKQYGVHMKGEAALTVGSLAVESVPVVQGIKFESSGVATELPTIKLVKGNMTSPIYSMDTKYNYPLFKLGIVADAPVTFVDDTAQYFLPDELTITGSNGVYTVTAK